MIETPSKKDLGLKPHVHTPCHPSARCLNFTCSLNQYNFINPFINLLIPRRRIIMSLNSLSSYFGWNDLLNEYIVNVNFIIYNVYEEARPTKRSEQKLARIDLSIYLSR